MAQRSKRIGRWRNGALAGALAGAAGVTALNAATYLDRVVRGGSTSTMPEDAVESLSRLASLPIPGDAQTRSNRVAGLGPLLGVLGGVGTGAGLGVAHTVGWLPGPLITGLAATVGAVVGGNGPMAALGVTDPRTWAAQDWVSDVVPQLAYGVVTAYALRRLL